MLLNQLQSDLKTAQLGRDEIKVSTLRLLLSEIKYAQIAKGVELAGVDIISIIQREVKKRKEAIAGFRSGNREEAAQKEEAEEAILKTYLPTQLSTEELTKIVARAINECGANSITDMGKVIGLVMSKVSGQADGSMVSALVKEKLTESK